MDKLNKGIFILKIGIGIIVYLAGGWIVKDIVYSIIDLGTKTLTDLYKYEFCIYTAVTLLYSVIIIGYKKFEDAVSTVVAVVVILGFLVFNLPISIVLQYYGIL